MILPMQVFFALVVLQQALISTGGQMARPWSDPSNRRHMEVVQTYTHHFQRTVRNKYGSNRTEPKYHYKRKINFRTA